MKKFFALTVICFAVSLFACASARAEDKPAAIVVKATGDVKVKRGDKQKTITGKFALAWGDKVVVSGGGSALVLFTNGKKVDVKGTLEITEKTAAIDGVVANSNLAGMAVSSAAKGKNADLKGKSGGVGGMVRAAGGGLFPTVSIVSILNSRTIDVRPTFAWETSAPANESTIELLNEDGETVWTTKTKDTFAAMPDDKPALTPGVEYTLTVKSVIDGDEVETSSTFFVLGEAEIKEINKVSGQIKDLYKEGDDIVIQHMLLTEYYIQKEMYMEAIYELKKLIALDENDISSHIRLAEVYEKIGDKASAKKEHETAATIQGKSADELDFQ